MRGRAIVILVGVAAACFAGRHDTTGRASNVMPAASQRPIVATSFVSLSSEPQETRRSFKAQLIADSQKADLADQPSKPDVKHRVEVALTAAAIAAILIQASRDQYHAAGRPCACPDDRMRNGSACGGRSAYSRPGGAAPLCYTADVTPSMIEAYRKTITK
jgi:hypothetical protein